MTRQEKEELLKFVSTATAKQRDDLEDTLNEAKHRRDQAVVELRGVVNSHDVYYPEAAFYIKELADKIVFETGLIEDAEQELDMHDNPDKWREWAEESAGYEPDYKEYETWG